MIETHSAPYVRTIEIDMPNSFGFSLLQATKFVQCVKVFHSKIQVRNSEILANGRNILELLMLGVSWESKLKIDVIGSDALKTVESIEHFFNQET
ncbi:MAG: HPr family phosphocarrier protein [Candidatus Omnitrophica bacterium]|nr:HPr family phosphocarrier protein [Candidatus Omnitrophota bacterium]